MGAWLVKQEPGVYPFARLVADGRTVWDGVRNLQARNHLREMRAGDPVLYYHTGVEKAVVGLARVAREAYPDPTGAGGDWVCVDLEPVRALASPVPLARIKADPALGELKLVRQPRLSVVPIPEAGYRRIVELGDGQA